MAAFVAQPMAASDHSGSAASADDVVHATASLLPLADAADACLWQPGLACVAPRSCYDCLNSRSTKGECMVDAVGRCVGLKNYASASDFREGNAASLLYDYPSTNTSYCEASDARCAACRSNVDATGWYFIDKKNKTVAPFCEGDRGCVCVATCEAPAWNATVLSVCSSSATAVNSPANTMYIVVVVVTSAICALIFFFSARWVRFHSASHMPPVDMPLPRSHRPPRLGLALTGWYSMRQKLIDEETNALNGRANPGHRLEATAPSAA